MRCCPIKSCLSFYRLFRRTIRFAILPKMADNSYTSSSSSTFDQFSEQWYDDAKKRITEIQKLINNYVNKPSISLSPDGIVYNGIAAVVERDTAPSNEQTPEYFFDWARSEIGSFDAVDPPKGSQIDRLLRRIKLELGGITVGAEASSDGEGDSAGADEVTADDTVGGSAVEGEEGAEDNGQGGEDGMSGEAELHSRSTAPSLTTLPDGFVEGLSGEVVVYREPIRPLLAPQNDEERE